MPKIDSLFDKLIEQGGSDLHLEQGQKPKIRLHGELNEMEGLDVLTEESLVGLMEEIASKDWWQKYLETGDLDFAYAYEDKARFRANYFRHFYGYGCIFRIIPSEILSLDKIGMPETLYEFADYRSGLVLITGPTGSGKSTTLAAVIDHINASKTQRIITIEEPVEFLHSNKQSVITHREVGLDTDSFTSGLRGAIKSDTNVILVGEMRDQETISLALKAAEMGILVFGTLHTNSAAKTVDRIIDVFPANQKNQVRSVLANTLTGIVAQQLLKSADGARRWVSYEILLRTTSLPSIIRAGETVKLTSEIQLNKQRGMILMDDCLRQLVSEGKVAQSEAYLKALDKASFMDVGTTL